MKKNLTKKLMLSVLTLAFAVVSLGASTFAWFTVSKEAEVEKFTMDVTADAGIQIAVGTVYSADVKDGEGKLVKSAYKSTYYINKLPAAEITNTFKANEFSKFLDLTSYNPNNLAEDDTTTTDIDESKLTKFGGVLYNKDGAEKREKDGYVALRFYVSADAAGTITVTIPWLEQAGQKVAWAAGSEFKRESADAAAIGANEYYQYDVLSAARMSVFYNNEYVTYQNQAVAISGSAYGNTEGYAKQDECALAIYNSFNGYTADKELKAPTTTEVTKTIAEKGTHEFTIPAERNVEYSFDLYIWLEGFDAECVNAIFAQQIKASVSFKFAQESQTN